MIKKYIIFVALILSTSLAKAQSTYEIYLDFNGDILKNKPATALALAEKILASDEKLPGKTQTNFYFKLARLYEDAKQPLNAIDYYEKVNLAEPDYYVVNRALGYLYISQAEVIELKMDALKNYKTQYDYYSKEYLAIIKKILFHLEKAQACDPDNGALEDIKHFYGVIKDTEGLKSLNSRLKEMSGHCVSLLTDE